MSDSAGRWRMPQLVAAAASRFRRRPTLEFAIGALGMGGVLVAGALTAPSWPSPVVALLSFAVATLSLLLTIYYYRDRRARERIALMQEAFDALGDAVAIYDACDRFVACNRQFRTVRNKNPLSCKPGAHFADILRSGIAVGEIPPPSGSIDDWIAVRLAERRRPFGSYIQHRGNRWLRLTDRRTPRGHLVSSHTDITELKTAELELRASQAEVEKARKRMADWAEAANDWFWETDSGGRFTYISDGIEKALGVTPSEIVGRPIDMGRIDEDQERWAAHFQLMAERRPFRDFVFARRVNDRERYVNVSGKPIFDDHGTFVGYRGSSRDVTTHVEFEQKLRRQTEVLSSLIENLPLAVSLVGPDLRYLAFNSEFLTGFGLSPQDLAPGDPFEKFIRRLAMRGEYGPGDVDTLVQKRMARATPDPGPERFEVGQKSGRIIDVRILPLAGGGFVTTRIDVTDERLREAALKFAHRELERQTEILATLIKNLPVGAISVDAELRFVAMNDLFLEMFELTPEIIKVGDPFEKFLRFLAERDDFAVEDIEAIILERIEWAKRGVPREFGHNCRNGRVLEIRRVKLATGGFITTYIDVTDARRREAEIEEARSRLAQLAEELTATADHLRAANEAKSLFLANMSHELRTPLNAILGFSELIRDALVGPLDTRYREYAGDVHTAGGYLLRLINDILDSSKLEMGQLELVDEEVELAAIIGECQRLLFEKSRDAKVALAVSLPRDGCRLRADRLRVKQIVLNLLSNAVKFTPPGGRVSASATFTVDGGMALDIADTGIGMRPEDIPLALQIFRQLDNRFARRYEGSGLGLPLARALTELHGGTLAIESAPERGTSVRVWFPPDRLISSPRDKTADARH